MSDATPSEARIAVELDDLDYHQLRRLEKRFANDPKALKRIRAALARAAIARMTKHAP